MVGPAELPNAVALNSSLFNASRVVGPAIAGLLIAAAGTGVCFVVNAASFLAVLLSLYLLRPDELTPVVRRETRVVSGIREGVAWAFRDPLVRTVLVVVTVVSTVGFNFHVLVPLLASQTLHAGAETFGILSSAFGLGALAGALTTASLREASTRVFVGGAVGFSVVMLGLALVDSTVPALALLFALGVSFSLFTSSASALVQLASPDHLRGRVASLFLFAFAGLAPSAASWRDSWPSRVGRRWRSASPPPLAWSPPSGRYGSCTGHGRGLRRSRRDAPWGATRAQSSLPFDTHRTDVTPPPPRHPGRAVQFCPQAGIRRGGSLPLGSPPTAGHSPKGVRCRGRKALPRPPIQAQCARP